MPFRLRQRPRQTGGFTNFSAGRKSFDVRNVADNFERPRHPSSLRPHHDECIAVALGDQLAVLLEGLMMEGDDARARA